MAWTVLGGGPMVRDMVLVLAEDPLRGELAELVHRNGYEVRAPKTPLQVIDALTDVGDRISHAVISLDLPHELGVGMCEFLADEYPDIQCVTLDGTPAAAKLARDHR